MVVCLGIGGSGIDGMLVKSWVSFDYFVPNIRPCLVGRYLVAFLSHETGYVRFEVSHVCIFFVAVCEINFPSVSHSAHCRQVVS